MSKKSTKADQIVNLTSQLTAAQVDEAKSLAVNKALVVRLAFKLIVPVQVDRGGLTKSQYEIYMGIKAENSEVAESWRTKRLADNVAKKAAKAAKPKTVKKAVTVK